MRPLIFLFTHWLYHVWTFFINLARLLNSRQRRNLFISVRTDIQVHETVELILEPYIRGHKSWSSYLIMVLIKDYTWLHEGWVRLCVARVVLTCQPTGSLMMHHNFSFSVHIRVNHHPRSVGRDVLVNLHVLLALLCRVVLCTVGEKGWVFALLLLPGFPDILCSKIWISLPSVGRLWNCLFRPKMISRWQWFLLTLLILDIGQLGLKGILLVLSGLGPVS